MNSKFLRSIGALPILFLLTAPGLAGPLHESDPDTPALNAADPVEPAADIETTEPEVLLPAAPAPISPLLPGDGPWRLDEVLGTADWLTLEGHQRTRYESLDEQFRASGSGSDQLFAFRTMLRATATHDAWTGTFEVLDSRQENAPLDSPLNTGTVNAVAVQQLNLAHKSEGVFQTDDTLTVKLGRQTLNLGSRRFVARNRFRNTINSFTGVHGGWESSEGNSLQAFWFLPVRRRPGNRMLLLNNEREPDEEYEEVQFLGLFGTMQDVLHDADLDVYLFGLDESDAPGLNTRNRQHWTLGSRLHKKPAVGEIHATVEAAVQIGESRASTSAMDTTDLDHEAAFFHLTVGQRFEGETKPTLAFQFDIATGDGDPTDNENGRFDTLYGARRFDFGPTGIFGPFARSNIMSPGLRYTMDPTPDTNLMVAYRLYRLESDRDAWTTSGLVDPTGAAGDDLGSMFEFRLRYDVAPKSLRIECGAAYFAAGSFVDNAPGATTQGDALYGYIGTTFSF